MNIIRKTFLFVLTAVLLSCLLNACSVEDSENADNSDSYTDEIVVSSGSFSGTFRIKTESTDSLNLDPDSSISTSKRDAIALRYSEVAANNGCVIDVQRVEAGEIMSTVMASTAAARSYADLVELTAINLYEMYKGGYLINAELLENFDITDEKWGFDGQKALLTFSTDKTYGFRNLYWGVPIPSLSGVVYYNSDIISSFGAQSPHELYENGDWNWDNFKEICVTVTDPIDDRQGTFAFATPTVEYPAMINAVIYSNGGQRIIKDDKGVLSCGFDTGWATVNALQWLSDLITLDRVSYDLAEGGTALDIEAFVNFYTAFLITDTSAGFSDSESYPLYTFDKSLRLISFPAGDSFMGGTTAYYSGYGQYLGLVKTTDVVNTGKLLGEIFEPLEGDDTESWKAYIKRNYFFHDSDYAIYEKMLSSAVSDGSVITGSSNDAVNALFSQVAIGYKTPKEAVEQIASVVTELIVQ